MPTLQREIRYLTAENPIHLRRYLEARALQAKVSGAVTAIHSWALLDTMAAIGLDPRYATHSSRHTYATHLYQASGHDLETVQEQLGHASIKTTTIYARVTKEDKLRAADALGKVYRDSQRNRQRGASWPRRRPGSPGVSLGSVASP